MSVKQSWSRVKDHQSFGRTWNQVFRKKRGNRRKAVLDLRERETREEIKHYDKGEETQAG